MFRLSFILLAFPFFLHAQAPTDRAAAVKNLIDSRNYVFLAQTAIPQGQAERRIETDFSMTIGKDTIIVDLPYFGNANAAPMDDSQNPLQFNSVKFDYTVTPGKKEGWVIKIRTKDAKGILLSLTVLSNGYATLQVNSPKLEPISFNGSVASPPTAAH
jgi:hypothetical protein